MRQKIGILVVLSGLVSLTPRIGFAQDAATVTCKDGSTSKAGKGACSHHGGVAKGTPAAPAPAAPRNDNATPPATSRAPAQSRSPSPTSTTGKPTAMCKDGSTSYSAHHSGACSHHGGVKQWLDTTP
jgi:hypothetical protein